MKKWAVLFAVLSVVAAAGSLAVAQEKPSLQAKLYGFVKVDGSWDQNLTSHGNFVMWVEPRAYLKDDEQFNMTANQSQIGVLLTGQNYTGVQVNGRIEFDLYAAVTGASIPQNRAMIMLRHAYFSVQWGNTKLVAGQTFDIISPLNPPTLNYPVLWGSGNVGYRRAQVSVWRTIPSTKQTTFTAAAGAFRTIGDDLTPTFSLAAGETAEGADDGTDAGIPSFQGIFEGKHTFAAGGHLRAGVSGLWGRLKAETTLGNYETYKSWGVVGHAEVVAPSGSGVSGEVFSGTNLGTYYGGILQKSTVDGVDATGAWTSAWVTPTPQTKLAAGFGVDNPNDENIVSGRVRNLCGFGNITYSFVPQAKVGLELSNWQTEYKNGETAKTWRVQSSFILSY